MIPELSKLVDVVHKNDGEIAAQLMHAGWFGHPDLCGSDVVGPSAMVNPANNLKVRELSGDQVYEYVEDFVHAARRAFEVDFEAVQVHRAHGWFMSVFLSPLTTFRQDDWGGIPEKRANLILVGGMRELTDIRDVIDGGTADAVSLYRPVYHGPAHRPEIPAWLDFQTGLYFFQRVYRGNA